MTIPSSTILSFSTEFNAINISLQEISTILKNQPFWNTQLFGIIIGAMVGLIPFFYLLYKDRPIIKVRAEHVHVSPFLGSLIHDGLSITISNFGRRPINIENVFLKFADGESLLFMSNKNFIGGNSGLPKNLTEGSSHTVVISAGEIARPFMQKKNFKGDKDYPVYACCTNSLGRVYKCKISRKSWYALFQPDDSDKKAK